MANKLNRKILKLCGLIEKSPFLIAKLPMSLSRFKKALFLMPEEEIDRILATAVLETTNAKDNE